MDGYLVEKLRAVAGADHYDIWVNDLSTGQSAVLRDQDVTGASWVASVALKAGEKYRWWLRAVDVSGSNLSAWSSPLDFSVGVT